VKKVNRKIRDQYTVPAQECGDYEPIRAVKNLALDYGEAEAEDAGCDSCIHSNNGQCEVYKNENNL
jgi:hypothetical protein